MRFGQGDANGIPPCPACEGRGVKLVLPRRGLVVAPEGESGEWVPEPDLCSLCAGSGQEPTESVA